MRHRINEWTQRLLIPAAVIAVWILLHIGLSVSRALGIVLAVCAAIMLLMVIVAPGPRAKELFEILRNSPFRRR